MRNDARPIGHDAEPKSPLAEDAARGSVTHDRQSHIVNREREEKTKRDDADVDPVMPTGDSTLKTKI